MRAPFCATRTFFFGMAGPLALQPVIPAMISVRLRRALGGCPAPAHGRRHRHRMERRRGHNRRSLQLLLRQTKLRKWCRRTRSLATVAFLACLILANASKSLQFELRREISCLHKRAAYFPAGAWSAYFLVPASPQPHECRPYHSTLELFHVEPGHFSCLAHGPFDGEPRRTRRRICPAEKTQPCTTANRTLKLK